MSSNQKEFQDIKDMVLRVLQEKDQWSKHISHSCQKGQQFNRNKHKNKFTPMKLGLSATTSTYNDTYKKRNITFTQKIQKPKMNYSSYQLIKKSQYRNEYDGKKNNLQKMKQIKGKSNIELGGPTFSNTTYHETFTTPKTNAKQSLLKNLNNINSLGMRMNTHSNYRDTYKQFKKMPATKPIKRANNIKTENNISNDLNQSNYTWSYKDSKPFQRNPEIDNFKPKRSYTCTKGIKIKTSYQNDYSQKKSYICPAQCL